MENLDNGFYDVEQILLSYQKWDPLAETSR